LTLEVDAYDSVDLVREALAGDQDALARLVAILTPVIQARVARTLLARRSRLAAHRTVRQEVEDLTQEIFLSLFAKNGHVLRDWDSARGLSLENFVGLVSERHVVSFLRSSRRNPWKEEPVPADGFDAATRSPGPEETTAKREQLRLLLERLRENLSPLGRHVFELLFVQELTVAETMATSGLSADAVYAWRSRLRRLARKLMAELSERTILARTTKEDGEE
jgi:RNA polymerase sigma factor (sigma-70 family)